MSWTSKRPANEVAEQPLAHIHSVMFEAASPEKEHTEYHHLRQKGNDQERFGTL